MTGWHARIANARQLARGLRWLVQGPGVLAGLLLTPMLLVMQLVDHVFCRLDVEKKQQKHERRKHELLVQKRRVDRFLFARLIFIFLHGSLVAWFPGVLAVFINPLNPVGAIGSRLFGVAPDWGATPRVE